MSTNRNKEAEQAFLMMQVKDYIREEGAVAFLKDMEYLQPETLDALVMGMENFLTLRKTDARLAVLLKKPT